ncbi:MAG TPA: lysophospholipid acyltransferase family protein [Marinagarivorans sp.]|nr:lysophospholipid acyltransferase family protein [Cellvibrionaceae bacterium]HMY39568.1 lysophospholipid acyltransferase family protein [Marinagarivorans sp.]HNG58633.1 lysophospholipid acyltransferase family protein [Cellvibrionaceae bacterium]
MLTWLRSALFSIVYIPSTVFYGAATQLVRWLPPSILPPAKLHRFVITWCRLNVEWLRITVGARYQVSGLEHLQNLPGPVMVLAKHQSTWETLFLQLLFFPAITVLKRELLSIPFFGWGLRGLRPVAIDRSNPRDALKLVKERGLEQLAAGNNMLLFPEGTRTQLGERGKYARSGADIAISAGVPVIPVALNSGKCWPPKQLRKYPGLISVVIGAPIPTEGRTSKELIEQVENWIEGELARIAAEEAQAGR